MSNNVTFSLLDVKSPESIMLDKINNLVRVTFTTGTITINPPDVDALWCIMNSLEDYFSSLLETYNWVFDPNTTKTLDSRAFSTNGVCTVYVSVACIGPDTVTITLSTFTGSTKLIISSESLPHYQRNKNLATALNNLVTITVRIQEALG